MLTHLDSLRRTSQARHVGPPGEVPSSIAQPGEPIAGEHVGPPGEAHPSWGTVVSNFPHRETLRKARHVGPPSEGSHESQNREGRVGEKDRPGCRPV